MDWKLLTLTNGNRPVCLAPLDDDGGASSLDNGDDDTYADDDGDGDDAGDDDGDDAGDDDDGDDAGDDDGDVGKGAQKRIRQLNETAKAAKAEVESLRKQLEEAKKPAKKVERQKLHDKPVGKTKPKATAGRKANWGDVGDEGDFVRMIAASQEE